MTTGTGLPTPKGFGATVTNGSDREVIVTPPAGQRVTLYGFAYDDVVVTAGLAQVFVGGNQVFTKTADDLGEFVSLGYPQAFEIDEAVTVRVTATTTGNIWVSAGTGP